MQIFPRYPLNMILGLVLLIAFITLAPHKAQASGLWYVAPTGNDANDCASAATPCLTINAALGKPSFVAGDTIKVAIGTYTAIHSAQVVLINKDVTLSGGWTADFSAQTGTSTIDGSEWRRGITIRSGTVVIDHLTIQHGLSSGGGIANDGTLTINHSAIIDNKSFYPGDSGSGGGIYNNGKLTINDSRITGNRSSIDGGGIVNSAGTLILNRSTVSDNVTGISGFSGGGGGGIFTINGPVVATESTISNNALQYAGDGGGIFALGPVTLNNSTLTGNKGGQGVQVSSELILNNSTITNNERYGIYLDGGTLKIQNTIIANNGQADCAIDHTYGGAVISQGHNLIENNQDCPLATSDRTSLDPKLGRLRNNGGPTRTQALLFGSPALDAGDPTGCKDRDGNPFTTDQRGITRPQGTHCDIGAFELQRPYVDLGITKTDSPDPVASNANLTYSLVVHNRGVDSAPNVVISDTVPVSTTFQSANGIGWTCAKPPVGGTGTLSCAKAILNAGETAGITLVVKVDAGVTNATTVANTATVSSDIKDWREQDNRATAKTCVGKPAKPELVSPGEGELESQPRVLLDWNEATCATRYRVIARQDDPRTGEVADKQGGLTVTQFTTRSLRAGHTYYWRVYACNSLGCSKSGFRSFIRTP